MLSVTFHLEEVIDGWRIDVTDNRYKEFCSLEKKINPETIAEALSILKHDLNILKAQYDVES